MGRLTAAPLQEIYADPLTGRPAETGIEISMRRGAFAGELSQAVAAVRKAGAVLPGFAGRRQLADAWFREYPAGLRALAREISDACELVAAAIDEHNAG